MKRAKKVKPTYAIVNGVIVSTADAVTYDHK